MGVSGCLAGDGTQPEAHAGIEIGRADVAVVEADRLALTVFQEEFAIVAAAQGLADDLGGGGLVQRGIGSLEEQLVSGGDGAHEGQSFNLLNP